MFTDRMHLNLHGLGEVSQNPSPFLPCLSLFPLDQATQSGWLLSWLSSLFLPHQPTTLPTKTPSLISPSAHMLQFCMTPLLERAGGSSLTSPWCTPGELWTGEGAQCDLVRQWRMKPDFQEKLFWLLSSLLSGFAPPSLASPSGCWLWPPWDQASQPWNMCYKGMSKDRQELTASIQQMDPAQLLANRGAPDPIKPHGYLVSKRHGLHKHN